MTVAIDHIIYAVQNLEDGINHFETLTGIRPKFGGQHAGKGSHNALADLGNGVYLEIIAPDPSQPEPPTARSFGLDKLTAPKLVTWAVNTTDLEETSRQATGRGYDPGPVRDGGRKRPDGLDMKWRSSLRPEAKRGETPPGDWLIPFVIEWGAETPHPSTSNPAGATLIKLEATHPEPTAIRQMLSALGIEIEVNAGDEIALIATLESPKGIVQLK